jgi:hypothetical protein
VVFRENIHNGPKWDAERNIDAEATLHDFCDYEGNSNIEMLHPRCRALGRAQRSGTFLLPYVQKAPLYI